MKAVRWTGAAKADLTEIFRFIAADNLNAARRVRDDLYDAAEKLGANQSGRPGRYAGTYEKIVRRLPYIIAFDLPDQSVRILRIIHMARNWPAGEWPED